MGVLGGVWELLARQAPSSAWHVAGFPGAIERFARHAWIEGLAIFVLAPRAWAAVLSARPRQARTVVLALGAGTVLALGARALSAATGVLGTQLRDVSVASRVLLLGRAGGDLLLLVALVLGVRAAMREA
jgi:hypothetical protein